MQFLLFQQIMALTKGKRMLLGGICTILVLTIITLTVIAIIIGTTFKKPDVNVTAVRPASPPVINFDVATGRLDTQAIVDVTVKNPNSYDIYLSSYEVIGSFAEKPDVPFGVVNNDDGVDLKANGAETPFSTPISIGWDPSKDSDGAVLQTLLTSCAGNAGPVNMVYKVTAYVKIWGIGPIKVPRFEQRVTTTCPFSLPGGINPAAILSAVNGVKLK